MLDKSDVVSSLKQHLDEVDNVVLNVMQTQPAEFKPANDSNEIDIHVDRVALAPTDIQRNIHRNDMTPQSIHGIKSFNSAPILPEKKKFLNEKQRIENGKIKDDQFLSCLCI